MIPVWIRAHELTWVLGRRARRNATRILTGLVSLVSAQSIAGELPQEIRVAIERIGPVINAPDTARLIAPLQ